MSTAKLEARIEALEAEVSKLKEQLAGQATPAKAGWRAMVGIFPNDELTRKAQQYARDYRQSMRPKNKKGKKNRVHTRHRSHESAAA
jgi:hypothetical protein